MYVFSMTTVENTQSLEKTTDVPKESNTNGRSTSAEFNNIQDGGHVESSIPTSSLQPNSVGALVPSVTAAQVVVAKDFPALQNTTKPIPPSVFSYRFASPTSNQTPYYVSSDIVLSGGIAQQTRRRIVHNEVERRRKDKINNWIWKLAQVVPQCRWGKQSKNIVLEKTVEYINQVNDQLKEMTDLQQREQKLAQEVQQLKSRLGNVTKENKVLKDILKKHSIAIPRKIIAMQDSNSAIATPEKVNVPVAITAVSTSTKATPGLVTLTSSKPMELESQGTVGISPTVVTTVTQVPITSASVAGPVLRDSSKKETIAYVAPFIIANNLVSLTTSKTSVVTSVTPSFVPVVAPVVQNTVSDTGQQGLNQLQRTVSDSTKLCIPHQGIYTQHANNLVNSSAQQPVQTASDPVSSSQLLTTSHTGFSQHSVAAIMKVALQPGVSASPVSVVNAAPLATPAMGNNTTAILNVQNAVVNSPVAVSSTSVPAVLVSSPSTLPVSSSLMNQVPGTENAAVSQSGSLPTFYQTAAPNHSMPVALATQNNGSMSQQKASNAASKNLGGNKNIKSTSFSKAQGKSSARTQNAKSSSQNKALPENRTSSGTNKRAAAHLPVTSDAIMAKRTNTVCNPQETPGNTSICQPQDEIMTLQTFNMTALIPGIATQSSSPNNDMVSNRDDWNKPATQVSTMAASQTVQVPRLSHSIASLAGLSQSIGQPQPSSEPQQHQQISQLGSGNLSFSAESLLASNDVFLPNIPHITTNSVSDNNTSQQNSLTVVPVSSLHSSPSDQGHAQSFSNYSAEALIGGSEIMGESVIAHENQTQPSRTTYSDFSAESLIGSNDLNSSLSYAIDNLISSRSDANYNSTAMVSVNPNLLHSVKSNISQDMVTNPLRALAALPELVEQKSSIPSSQPTLLYSGTMSNSTYGLSPSNCAPTPIPLQSNSTSRQRDSTMPHQGVAQTGNSSNSSVSSTSFLKHSVDSITSSFYAVSTAGSSFSVGSITNSGISFQTQGSFGVEPLSGGQLSFGSLANPFSPTRPLFNHSSTMGSFV